VEDNTWG